MIKKKLWFLCAGVRYGRLPECKIEGSLISAVSDCGNPIAIEKTKAMLNKANPRYLMLDSGGFQVLNAEARGAQMSFSSERPIMNTKNFFNIFPRHVPETAIEVQADSMVALDFPIRKITDPDEREREFRNKLEYNVRWAIETAELRNKLCPHIDLFIPVQAYNLNQFEEFYIRIKGIDFDGFSFPVRNMRMTDIAAFLFKMHKWGIRKAHVLGSSSLSTIIVSAYMSQRFFDFISFDATSWRAPAQHGVFLYPSDLCSKNLNESGTYDPEHTCDCQSCKGKTLGQIAALGKTRKRIEVLMTHNFLAISNVAKEFDKTLVDFEFLRERFKDSKRRRYISQILRDMSKIEDMCSMKKAA